MAHSPRTAARVAGYLIERPIASGAVGTVYRAIDERLGRRVALKVLSDATSAPARERFLRDVRMVAGLRHPNVVSLYDAGEDRGVVWAAMELMPASLSQELHQRGRFSADDLRGVARAACLGLDAVWKRGIVHRDIKPSNLMRGDDRSVKVADFGLAKDLSLELNMPGADVVLGTPWYVSPEQAAGKPAAVSSDLYSLGATLYHLAAGRPPFDSANALDVIVRHAIEPVPPLPEDVPAPVARLIMWLLEKESLKRPANYQDALSAIDRDTATDREPPTTDDDGLSRSVMTAARTALQLGRGKRVRSLLEPLVTAHGSGWVRAGFLVATAMTHSRAVSDARAILEDIVANAEAIEDRALALWELAQLAEKDGAQAPHCAIEIYTRLGEMAGTRLPKALLDARIARLRARQHERGGRRVTPPA